MVCVISAPRTSVGCALHHQSEHPKQCSGCQRTTNHRPKQSSNALSTSSTCVYLVLLDVSSRTLQAPIRTSKTMFGNSKNIPVNRRKVIAFRTSNDYCLFGFNVNDRSKTHKAEIFHIEEKRGSNSIKI